MTLKIGVMMLKIQLCITEINYILKYIQTKNNILLSFHLTQPKWILNAFHCKNSAVYENYSCILFQIKAVHAHTPPCVFE